MSTDSTLTLNTLHSFLNPQPLLIYTDKDGKRWVGLPETITPCVTFDKTFCEIKSITFQMEWMFYVISGKPQAQEVLNDQSWNIVRQSLRFKTRAAFEKISIKESTDETLILSCSEKGQLEITINQHLIARASVLLGK
ncbi:MAG: hypothetical protein V4697_04305 [Patescibacteria group bacterium]